jgi:ACS family phthalate transporter-like MFS transporter
MAMGIESAILPVPVLGDPGREVYRKINWRLLPLLFVCYVLNYIDRVNVSFAHLQFKQDLGFSDAAYGFGVGIFFVGYILFEVPSNLLMRRVGARRTITRIMVLWGLISSATMFVHTPMQFYAARIALGIAEAGFFPGIILYLTYWFPSTRRARVTSRFVMAIAVSGIVGGMTSGWIMHSFDGVWGMHAWRWLFFLEGLPSVVVGVLVYFCLADRPEDAPWLTDDQKRIVRVDLDADEALKEKGAKTHTFVGALKNSKVYIAAVGWFIVPWPGAVINFWAPSIIKQSGVTDLLHVGLLSAIPYVCGAISMLAVCWHSDRKLERRWHFGLSALVAAMGVLTLSFFTDHWLASIVWLSVMTAGYLAATAMFWSIPTAFLSGSAAAGSIALISSLGQVGGLLAPAALGWLKTYTGSIAPGLWLVAMVVGLGVVIVLRGIPVSLLREQ